ncbi:MAG TPA: ABC transporter permease, partial [Blastocatellia bacterium]
QKEGKSWESIGAWATNGVNIAATGAPIRVTAVGVTRSLIETLGVQPALGRNFTPEEDAVGGPRVAIISHSLWRRAFGGQPDIIGKEIMIDARPFNIIGVMPQGYVFPPGSNDPAEVWAPFQFDPANPGNRGSHFLNLIGRLKAGATIDRARSEMEALMAGWKNEARAQHLLQPDFHPVLMSPLHEDVVGGAKSAVLMLLGAVAFVLLIACANVASLLLAQAEARHREFAVRLAMGAGRWRMLRQFLTEGMILALLGAVCGVALAESGLKMIMAAAPDSVPRAGEIRIDLLALALTLGVSMLAVFIFALAPLTQLRERNLAEWLRGSGKGSSAGASGQLLRKGLVVTEIALALVLVAGSGLMIRAFWKLRSVDPGFNPFGALSFTINLPSSAYPSSEAFRFSQSLQAKLSSIPGVKSAAKASGLPPLRPINANDTNIEGYQPGPNESSTPNVDFWNVVSSSYFKTMGIRLAEGRLFEDSDSNESAQRVVVINQALAKRYWRGNAIGGRLSPVPVQNDSDWFTVIGVVEDTKNLGVDKPAGTELYFLEPQVFRLFGGNFVLRQNFIVRAEGDPALIAGAVRAAAREIDPSLPIFGMQSMSDTVADSLARPRFLSLLLGAFSIISLAMAAVGIYGVMSYAVSQRVQEIGVRVALGARSSDVLKMVLGQGTRLAAAGVAIGLAGAFALTRVMSTLLFEVSVTDPATFAAVVALLAAVTLLACYIPAKRATRVDPMIALRSE